MGNRFSKPNVRAMRILEACADNQITILTATKQLQEIVSSAPEDWRFVGLGDCFMQALPRFEYGSHAQGIVVNVMIEMSSWFEERGPDTKEGNVINYCMKEYLKIKDSKAPDDDDTTASLNTAAFIGRLANACHYGPIYIAIMIITSALEKGHREDLGKAALCILHGGIEVFMCMLERVLNDEFADCFNCGPSYIGPETGLKRWRFWQRTFDASAKDVRVCELYRELAADAAKEMKAIEEDR